MFVNVVAYIVRTPISVFSLSFIEVNLHQVPNSNRQCTKCSRPVGETDTYRLGPVAFNGTVISQEQPSFPLFVTNTDLNVSSYHLRR